MVLPETPTLGLRVAQTLLSVLLRPALAPAATLNNRIARVWPRAGFDVRMHNQLRRTSAWVAHLPSRWNLRVTRKIGGGRPS